MMKTITKVYGFTLVEIIVGIVVLSIALMGGLSLLISQVDTFKDPLIREKSAQISKRIIHEIQIRSFDEKSDIGGGLFRCGETVSGVSLGECTPLQDYGPDSSEKVIVSLNDVDDFDTRKLCSRLTESYACTNDYMPVVYFFSDAADAAQQQKYNDYYADFAVKIEVSPLKIDSNGFSGKLITVTVKQSDGYEVDYSFVKANI
jgi:MSHA pilin protein MshD